ncbi:hypothetical protein YC2023_077739 [Brassica napus]
MSSKSRTMMPTWVRMRGSESPNIIRCFLLSCSYQIDTLDATDSETPSYTGLASETRQKTPSYVWFPQQTSEPTNQVLYYTTFLNRIGQLILVIGDIAQENLGLVSEIAAKISDEIDVTISCGGSTTFEDTYLHSFYWSIHDSALCVNEIGPGRILSFAKECKKLIFSQLFNWYMQSRSYKL